MASIHDEYDLMLAAPLPTEAQMAQALLADAGIPSLLHGKDRDFAELGYVVHNALTHPDLYVPKGARDRARAVLDAVWDANALATASPDESWDAPGSRRAREGVVDTATPATRRNVWIWILFVLALIAIAATVFSDHLLPGR